MASVLSVLIIFNVLDAPLDLVRPRWLSMLLHICYHCSFFVRLIAVFLHVFSIFFFIALVFIIPYFCLLFLVFHPRMLSNETHLPLNCACLLLRTKGLYRFVLQGLNVVLFDRDCCLLFSSMSNRALFFTLYQVMISMSFCISLYSYVLYLQFCVLSNYYIINYGLQMTSRLYLCIIQKLDQ